MIQIQQHGETRYRVEWENNYLDTAIDGLFRRKIDGRCRRWFPVGGYWEVTDCDGLAEFEESARHCGLEVRVMRWGDLHVEPLGENSLADYFVVEGGESSRRPVTVRVGKEGHWVCLTCHNRPPHLCEHAYAAKCYWEKQND